MGPTSEEHQEEFTPGILKCEEVTDIPTNLHLPQFIDHPHGSTR
jgi:hypothetical protein